MRTLHGLGVAICACHALACSAPGPIARGSPGAAVAARVDAIVQATMARQHVPGATVLVEHRGQRIVARGYGIADLENRVPSELDTVYQIASLTKQFTSAAILQLVEHGRIALDD